MLKGKMTKKEIIENYKNVIKVGYCEIQYLTHTAERMGFTAGVYGWNADIYKVDNDTVIVTGYRPFGNIEPKYDVIKKYEEIAKKVVKNWCGHEIYEELENLIKQFTNEVINN